MNSKLILVLLFIHIPKINVKNGQQRQFSDRGDLNIQKKKSFLNT